MTVPNEPHPLDEWVPGIREGSDAAFRAVYELTADDLASFANGMLRDRTEAEDIVQQAFLELVRSAPRFRGSGESLRVWLFKSVRFRCLDEVKRAGRRKEHPAARVPERAGRQTDPLDAVLDPALERAMEALSARQRTLVVLRHVVGMSGDEIASVMRTTRAAAYAALSRAEKKLRAEIGGGTNGS